MNGYGFWRVISRLMLYLAAVCFMLSGMYVIDRQWILLAGTFVTGVALAILAVLGKQKAKAWIQQR